MFVPWPWPIGQLIGQICVESPSSMSMPAMTKTVLHSLSLLGAMSLEAVVIILDNSQYSINGDYARESIRCSLRLRC